MPFILAPLPIVVIGLFALILILAGSLLSAIVSQSGTASGLDALAGGVIRTLAAGIQWAIGLLDGFFTAVARGVTSLFTAAPHALMTLIGSIEVTAWRHIALIRSIITEAVPSLYRTIQSTAASLLSFLTAQTISYFLRAVTYTNSIRDLLFGIITGDVAQLTTYINNVYRVLTSSIAANVALLSAYALALHANAIATIGAAVNQLQNMINVTQRALQAYALLLAQWAMNTAYGAAVDWARTYSDQTLARAKAATDAIATGVAAPAWPYAIPALDAISLALPDSVAAVLERIGTFPRAIPTEAGAIAGIGVAVGTIALDWVKDCGLSLCRNTKGFGDELSQLADDLLIGELIALIVEANRDPTGTAGDAVSSLAGIPHELGDDLTSIMTALI